MIEAINSTLAQAAATRAPINAISSNASFASDENEVREVAQVPYVSPTVRVDVDTKIAILEFRESSTGDVLLQVPSEQQIRAYQYREARQDAEIEAQTLSSNSGGDVEVSEAQIQREVEAARNATGTGASRVQISSSESTSQEV